MADCRIVNQKMIDSVTNIKTLAGEYASAGNDFESAFKGALAAAEGDSKDALIELFDKSYKTFLTDLKEGLPAMVQGLADLLEGNRTNFIQVDSQIAESIRGGGQ